MLWQEIGEIPDQVVIQFRLDAKNAVAIEVKQVSVTGQVVSLTELSDSFRRSQARTDSVLSVILAMQALTLLLSYWTESAIPIIADQPRTLAGFLTVSSRITRIWQSLEDEIVNRYSVKKRWHRR